MVYPIKYPFKMSKQQLLRTVRVSKHGWPEKGTDSILTPLTNKVKVTVSIDSLNIFAKEYSLEFVPVLSIMTSTFH